MGLAVRLLMGAVVLLTGGVPAVADEVDKVLRAWSDHLLTRPQSGVHFTARLYAYDDVFQTVTRASVEGWMRPAGELRLDFTPPEAAAGEVPRTTLRQGVPYTLVARRAERWVLTPEHMRQLSSGAKPGDQPTIHEVDLTPPGKEGSGNLLDAFAERLTAPWRGLQLRVANSMMMPSDLAFLLDRGREQWIVRFGSMHGTNGRIHLVLLPTSEAFSRDFSRVEVLMGRNFAPIGFRSFDAAGTSETVYAYSSWSPLEDDTEAFTEESLTRWPPGAKAAAEATEDAPPPPPIATMP